MNGSCGISGQGSVPAVLVPAALLLGTPGAAPIRSEPPGAVA
jgi:hypothetical protein